MISSQTPTAATGTVKYLGMPKSSEAAAMPANSDIVTSALAISSVSIAKAAPRTPKRSRIRSERPFPVAAPMRAHISCTTDRLTVMSTSTHSSLKPNCAPTLDHVATAPASLPALAAIKPGPKIPKTARSGAKRLLRHFWNCRSRREGLASAERATRRERAKACVKPGAKPRAGRTAGPANSRVGSFVASFCSMGRLPLMHRRRRGWRRASHGARAQLT